MFARSVSAALRIMMFGLLVGAVLTVIMVSTFYATVYGIVSLERKNNSAQRCY